MHMSESNDNTTNVTPLRKQQTLPGIGRDIPEVEAAAVRLKDHRVKRMAMQEKEAELADELVEAMAKHEVTAFKFDEDGVKFTARIKTGKVKVSVTKDKADAAAEDAA